MISSVLTIMYKLCTKIEFSWVLFILVNFIKLIIRCHFFEIKFKQFNLHVATIHRASEIVGGAIGGGMEECGENKLEWLLVGVQVHRRTDAPPRHRRLDYQHLVDLRPKSSAAPGRRRLQFFQSWPRLHDQGI